MLGKTISFMTSRSRYFLLLSAFIATGWLGQTARAATTTTTTFPLSVYQAVVLVQCDQRQGSGTVTNGNEGYVLTNAHVVFNIETNKQPKECIVGFSEVAGVTPDIFYHASIVRSAYSPQRDYDFAILQIGEPISKRFLSKPYPSVTTNEFAEVGEPVTVLGYSGERDEMKTRTGEITSFQSGAIQTTAAISPGDSGGAAVDRNGHLIGIPTRVVTLTTANTNEQVTTFELVDIRSVLTWMDSYGVNEHDRYIGHQDYDRYHENAVFISQTNLGCSDVARTQISPAVFCVLPGRERMAFPNNATFFSWYPDFSNVLTVGADAFAPFRLTRNVTFRPGTLVKSATAPSVFVVVDGFGTMRWIPTEEKAIALWGPGWASLVHDIPDEFWTNYTIGQPLDV